MMGTEQIGRQVGSEGRTLTCAPNSLAHFHHYKQVLRNIEYLALTCILGSGGCGHLHYTQALTSKEYLTLTLL